MTSEAYSIENSTFVENNSTNEIAFTNYSR